MGEDRKTSPAPARRPGIFQEGEVVEDPFFRAIVVIVLGVLALVGATIMLLGGYQPC